MNEVALIVLASLAASALLLGAALCLAARRADDAAEALLLPMRPAPLCLTEREGEALYRARHQAERALANLLYVAGTRSDPQVREQVLAWRRAMKRLIVEMSAAMPARAGLRSHDLLPISIVLGERWPA